MKAEDALEFVDKLVYTQTGKHLNDLERKVFLGSFKGKTYEEIYPLNPQYVEKYVGYKLWQKLSTVLGEKVTKKQFRGALERSLKQQLSQSGEVTNSQRMRVESTKIGTMQKVFISHWEQEPDLTLALQLCAALTASEHQTFRSTVGSTPGDCPHLAEDWIAQIDTQLKQCDYFLLLLSPQAAVSEMAIEKLRRAKELRDSRQSHKPIVLTIRVNCDLSVPLNHDLRSYLQGIGQREWKSSADTPNLIQDILNLIGGSGQWAVGSGEESFPVSTNPDEPVNSDNSSPHPPPLPVAEPELPSGQVRLASAFYVERVPHEALCYKEILQPGALIRIKAPRQMGKTSLMARILHHAKEQEYRTVPLSFQHADAAVFTNLNQLLQWFCTRITRKLRLPYQVDEFWTDTYGAKDNCTDYFQEHLLQETDSPLVLG